MDKDERRLLAELLRSGQPRPDLATLYVIQAVVELHNVVDELAREVAGASSGMLLGAPLHKHSAALQEVRNRLSIAITAATGRSDD